VDSLGISLSKCQFYLIYLFVIGVLLRLVVFRFRNTIFIGVSIKSFVIFLVSLPLYVKVSNFVDSIVYASDEIRTRHLENASQKYYRLSQLGRFPRL
jgi:type IV secretory pathway VirB3-like protein